MTQQIFKAWHNDTKTISHGYIDMISSMTVTRFKKKNNLEDGGGAWVDEKETRGWWCLPLSWFWLIYYWIWSTFNSKISKYSWLWITIVLNGPTFFFFLLFFWAYLFFRFVYFDPKSITIEEIYTKPFLFYFVWLVGFL